MKNKKQGRREFLNSPINRISKYFNKKLDLEYDVLTETVDRRDFLKGIGLAATGLTLNSFMDTGLLRQSNPIISSASAQSSSDKASKFTISGGSNNPKNYYIRTNGPIKRDSADQPQNHAIFGNKATGYLMTDSVQYTLAGLIKEFKFEQDLNFKVDGEEKTLQEVKQLCFEGADTSTRSNSQSSGNCPKAPVEDLPFSNYDDEKIKDAEELGMDPNGNEPIDSILRNTIGDDVLIEFPPGEYYFEDTIFSGNVSNWGIRGKGQSPQDVKFFTDAGEGKKFIEVTGGTNQLFENFSFDYSQADNGALGMLLKTEGLGIAKDIHYLGFNPTDRNGAQDAISPQATQNDARVFVDGLVRKGPTDITSHGSVGNESNEGGMWLGGQHEGELIVQNCHFENTGTNSIYASRTNGTVTIRNCFFRNNNQTCIRAGGGDGTYTIRNCIFEQDTQNPNNDRMDSGDWINPSAIIMEVNRVDHAEIRVENCDFHHKSGPDRSRLIFIDGNAGPVNIVNTRMRSEDSDVSLIVAREDPRWYERPDNQQITVEDSHLSGEGQIESRNGRPARVVGGCVSCPSEGFNINNADSSSCQTPDLNWACEQ